MSFANNQVFGDDITATYTSEVYPLGTERLVLGSQTGVGDQVWIFVKNEEAATAYELGDVVIRNTTSANGETILHTGTAFNPGKFVGVAQHAIAFGQYGWIVKKGVCTSKFNGSQDQGLILSTTARTFGSSATATTPVCGYALGAASGGVASVYVSAL
jgi:hypothetical protein